MEKLSKKKIALLFLLFLILALYQDCTSGNIESDGSVLREEVGGKNKELYFILNGEDVIIDYPYQIEIEAARITKEEADVLFSQTITEISDDFENVGETLIIKEEYAEGLVEAEWSFPDCDCIDTQGEIVQEKVPETGALVNARVFLECGAYEQIYEFSFRVEKKVLSEKEQLLLSLEEWIQQQMELEGSNRVQLPKEINGILLEWSEEQELLTLQVLLLEIMAVVILWWGQRKQQEQDEKKRIQSYESDYPDLVNQLSILLETGMTTRQAWSRIAAQYEWKRKNQCIAEKPAFEKVIYLNRRLQEGENERAAYRKFADEVNVPCISRLMRSLSNNLEKGTAGICVQLEQECKQAYEQRILTAKKLGEEASTRMLIPLMGMMLLVMVIILLPTIIGVTM